ncbi:MAG: alginate export family protein, partial [Planctomycetota bacterium]|nr:alginate export family protein [Planctomycetota bacterium]
MSSTLLLCFLSAICQEPAGTPVLSRGPAALTLDGEMRLRFESRDGATPFMGTNSESMSSGRFRFGLRAELNDQFSAYAQFQKLVVDEGEDSDDFVHQAFMFWDEMPFDAELQVGRFEMDIGSGLLVGTDDWNGTGRAFDGFRVTRQGETYHATVFWTQPVEEQAVADSVDQNFGGVWVEIPLTPRISLDVYGLTRGDRSGSISDLEDQTVGARIRGELSSGVLWSAELARQFGDHGALDAGGMIATGEAEMPFADDGRAALGFLWASGDEDGSDGDQDAFVPL